MITFLGVCKMLRELCRQGFMSDSTFKNKKLRMWHTHKRLGYFIEVNTESEKEKYEIYKGLKIKP